VELSVDFSALFIVEMQASAAPSDKLAHWQTSPFSEPNRNVNGLTWVFFIHLRSCARRGAAPFEASASL